MLDILRILCPNEYVDSLLSVDLNALRERGITALLLDLDNTLTAWQSYELSDEVIRWTQGLASKGMRACIVSNTHSPKRLSKLADRLGLSYTKQAAKPGGRGFREAFRLLDVQPGEVAVIGDQVFTDILGGNRLGLYTVLVKPIARREFIGTKISRLFERIVLRAMLHRGMPASPGSSTETREQSTDAGRQMETEL